MKIVVREDAQEYLGGFKRAQQLYREIGYAILREGHVHEELPSGQLALKCVKMVELSVEEHNLLYDYQEVIDAFPWLSVDALLLNYSAIIYEERA